MRLKIMTFNVQHFRSFNSGKIDYPAFVSMIRQSGAQIVGINESYGAGSVYGERAQAAYIADSLGWYWYFSPAIRIDAGTYGNSIVSAFPLKDMKTVGIPDPARKLYRGYYETRCVLCCTAEIENTQISIAVTHFGLNPDEQENAVKTVGDLIRSENFVLMGDFNVQPENPLLLPIYKKLNDTAFALKENRFTFPSDAPERRIDYIFVSKDFNILSAYIPPAVVSDHRPYVAEIESETSR